MARTAADPDQDSDDENDRRYAEKLFLYAALALAALRDLDSTQVIYSDHDAIQRRTIEVVRFGR